MAGKNGIEFSLFAPYNEEVALVGSWNNWQPIPMTKGKDGTWRVSVPLDDGNYEYKFDVKSLSYFARDQVVRVTDPRALCISQDGNDNACITVRQGQVIVTTYQWQHDNVPLPTNDQLVIYEMHVNEFSGGVGDIAGEGKPGRFQDVIDKLDYLVALGINALEVMPVSEFPGERSWGYNPRVLFAVENSYGTPDDLCRMVDECHARGIRVIMDGVYNHSEDNTPLAQIDYAYWYYEQNPDRPEHRWGPKFNYWHYDENLKVWPARQYIRDAILFWIDNFHIDGIRFDATAIIKDYDILSWLQSEIYNHLQGIKPFITIAEHVPEDPTVTGPDGPMDAAWHESYSKQIMCTIVGRDQEGHSPFNMDNITRVLDPRVQGFASPVNVVNYIDNHDQHRIMWQLGQAGFLDDAAFRRMKLGAAILLTSAGIPMIWMGQEFGESSPRMINERQTIDWALLQNERNTMLLEHYKALIHLRHNTPALKSDTIEVIFVDHPRALIAYKRWNTEGQIVIVVANLKHEYAGEFEIGHWPDGQWHEFVFNYDITVQGGVHRDTLAESEVKIFVKTA